MAARSLLPFLLLTAAAMAAGCAGPGDADAALNEVTLAPGAGHEVNLDLTAGQVVTWSWSSDAPVAFDIHAHDADGGVETFNASTSTGDDGQFTAPRDGTFSWYWRNTGAEDVRVSWRVDPEP